MELKPCPFCGGTADEPYNATPQKRPTWVILCGQHCGVRISGGTKKEIIEAWNRRTL